MHASFGEKDGELMSTVTSFSVWEQRGTEIAQALRRTCWDIGDWIVDGEDQHNVSDVLDRAEVLFELTRGTLQVYASVARAFPALSRLKDLTLGHHQAVMALPADQQQALLARAVAEPLSVRQLKDIINPPAPAVEITEPVEATEPKAPRVPLIHIDDGRRVRLQALAAACGRSAEEIVAELIDKRLAEPDAIEAIATHAAVLPEAPAQNTLVPPTNGIVFRMAELKAALVKIAAVAGKIGVSPRYHQIRIFSEGDAVKVFGADLDAMLTVTLPSARGSIDAAIGLQQLLDAVRPHPDEAVGNITLEGTDFIFTAGALVARHPLFKVESFGSLPDPPSVIGDSVELDLADFQRRIEHVQFAVPEKEGKHVPTIALVESTPEVFRLVATDGYRIAISQVPANLGEFKYTVAGYALNLVKKLDGGDKVTVAASEDTYYFQTDVELLTHRKTHGEFPPYEKILPTNHDGSTVVTVDAEKFLDCLKAVHVVEDADKPSMRRAAVTFAASGDELWLRTSTEDSSRADAIVPCLVEGQPALTRLDALRLLPFLQRAKGLVKFFIHSAASVLDFHANDGQRFLLMPLRSE